LTTSAHACLCAFCAVSDRRKHGGGAVFRGRTAPGRNNEYFNVQGTNRSHWSQLYCRTKLFRPPLPILYHAPQRAPGMPNEVLLSPMCRILSPRR
jgi:hypothetical protein